MTSEITCEMQNFARRAKQLCDAHRQDAYKFASAVDKVYYDNFDLLTVEEMDVIEAACLQLLKAECYDNALRAALQTRADNH